MEGKLDAFVNDGKRVRVMFKLNVAAGTVGELGAGFADL